MLQVSLASTSFSLPNLILSFCPAAKGILFKTFSGVFLYIDHSKWLLTDKMFTFYSIGWNLLFKQSSLALYFKIIILFHCFDFFSESQLCMCVCGYSVGQSCLTLCDPMDCSPSGSSVCGILQARILEWVAISFSRGSSWPRDWTHVSVSPALEGEFLTTNTTWEARLYCTGYIALFL